MQEISSFPKIVYKYRNWVDENHKNLLLKNQLYFASPKDFNDPFDCRISYNFSLLNTDEKIKTYLSMKRAQHNEEDIEEMIEKFEYRIRNSPGEVQDLFDRLYFEGVDNHYGVLSLSERWNSILMWSHYGNCHKGYCVGFWEERLRDFLVLTGGKVIYPLENDFPKIDPINSEHFETTIQQIHSKSIEWSYEREFRLTKVSYPEILGKKDRIQEISDDFFAEIVIGLKASSETREILMEIAKSKNINIFQAVKVPNRFEIGRKQIS